MGENERGEPAVWTPFLAGVGLIAALLLFAVLKLYCFNFTRGDEHMYNYMSSVLLTGKWPYRDFFHSHPPLPIYLTALVFSVTGYSFVAAKCVPIAAAFTSGIHLYLLGRRTLGPLEGLFAAVLFLFSFDVIRGSSHQTGVNVAVAFILAGTYQAVRHRPFSAGLLLACASLTGVYAVPMALMLGTLLMLRSLREAGRFALACVALLAAATALFSFVAGGAFVDQVVGFNLGKTAMQYSWYDKFKNVFFLNFALMSGFAPAIVWGACRLATAPGRSASPDLEPRLPGWLRRVAARVDPWGAGGVGAAALYAAFAFGTLFFYSNLRVYYSYYFMLVMPWMALLTAWVAVGVPRFVWRELRGVQPAAPQVSGERGEANAAEPALAVRLSRQARRAQEREAARRGAGRAPAAGAREQPWRFWPVVATAIALLLTFSYRERIGAARLREMPDTVQGYEFVPSPYLSAGLDRLVKAAFWAEVRDRREPPHSIARYLQHETIFVRSLDRFDAGVRSACRPGDRIFGDYSFGPYGASVSDCVVGADIIDINTARLSNGESSMSGWIAALEADDLDVMIWREPSSYSRNQEFRSYALANFSDIVFTWHDPEVGKLELRRRARRAEPGTPEKPGVSSPRP